MNKNLVVFGDILVFCLGVWFLSSYNGAAAGIAWAIIGLTSVLPLFRGTDLHHLLGIWLVRFFGLAVIGLVIGSQRLVMYSGMAAALLLVILALFWPKKDTPEYREHEEEAQKLHGYTPGSEDKKFWIVMAGIFFAIALFAVASMIYQVLFGDMADVIQIIGKAGGMFLALTLAAACLKTHAGTWGKSIFTIYDLEEKA